MSVLTRLLDNLKALAPIVAFLVFSGREAERTATFSIIDKLGVLGFGGRGRCGVERWWRMEEVEKEGGGGGGRCGRFTEATMQMISEHWVDESGSEVYYCLFTRIRHHRGDVIVLGGMTDLEVVEAGFSSREGGRKARNRRTGFTFIGNWKEKGRSFYAGFDEEIDYDRIRSEIETSGLKFDQLCCNRDTGIWNIKSCSFLLPQPSTRALRLQIPEVVLFPLVQTQIGFYGLFSCPPLLEQVILGDIRQVRTFDTEKRKKEEKRNALLFCRLDVDLCDCDLKRISERHQKQNNRLSNSGKGIGEGKDDTIRILEANPLHILIILKTFECLRLHTLHAKPWENEFESFSGQRLSEYIRQLILCPHEIQLNHSFFHLFFDEMMSDVDVFRPRVLNVCPNNLHDLRLRMRTHDTIKIPRSGLLALRYIRDPIMLAISLVGQHGVPLRDPHPSFVRSTIRSVNRRTGKYGDFDGYTSDDLILILEILSRRFFLRSIYLITGSSYDGNGDTSFQWSQFTAPCSHLTCSIKDAMTTKRPITQLLPL
ncbi:hypothetical protein Tco_1172386 [Tanacetum coccineum]